MNFDNIRDYGSDSEESTSDASGNSSFVDEEPKEDYETGYDTKSIIRGQISEFQNFIIQMELGENLKELLEERLEDLNSNNNDDNLKRSFFIIFYTDFKG